MSEALARTDFDVSVSRSPARQPRKGRAMPESTSWRVLMRPNRVVILGALSLSLLVAVAINAMVLQPARHPAPLFAPALPDPRIPVVLPKIAPVEPPARPVALAPAAPNGPVASSAPAERIAPKPAAPAAKGDQIGDLLRGNLAPLPGEAEQRIQLVQRGLSRMGYGAIKADGNLGPETRQAIEKFERDRKWPVTGEVSTRLMRELGLSGQAKAQ